MAGWAIWLIDADDDRRSSDPIPEHSAPPEGPDLETLTQLSTLAPRLSSRHRPLGPGLRNYRAEVL